MSLARVDEVATSGVVSAFATAGFEIGFAVEVCNVVEAESDAEGAETPVLNVLMSTRFSEVRATNSP